MASRHVILLSPECSSTSNDLEGEGLLNSDVNESLFELAILHTNKCYVFKKDPVQK